MMIALVDCNSFYASCEVLFRPDLVDKPVVVLSNNDGCIVALNSQAKALGIKRTDPLFLWKNVIKENAVAVFSSNYGLYGEISARVMSCLDTFPCHVEQYSIDEAFLHFPDGRELPLIEIKQRVRSWIGIPVSVGLSLNKTLAKAANRLAKHTESGTFVISEVNRTQCLKQLPVADIWGIGPASSAFLISKGIKTAFDFSLMDDAYVKKNLTLVGLKILWEIQGKLELEIEAPEPKKVIVSSKSFSYPVEKLDELKEAAADYVKSASEKLRAQNSLCTLLSVHLTTNYYQLDEPQYSKTALISLPLASNYTPDLVFAALKGLNAIFKPGYKYKKLLVTLLGLEQAGKTQQNLFYSQDPRRLAVMKAVDTLNRKFGRDTVEVSPSARTSHWMMARQFLSPSYTTKWKDIPLAHAGFDKSFPTP